jgi:hypothetical protein
MLAGSVYCYDVEYLSVNSRPGRRRVRTQRDDCQGTGHQVPHPGRPQGDRPPRSLHISNAAWPGNLTRSTHQESYIPTYEHSCLKTRYLFRSLNSTTGTASQGRVPQIIS